MNPLVIVLGVMLVVIISMSMFSRFFSGESALTSKANIKDGIPDIAVASITGADKSTRTYSIWVYMNTWTPTVNKMIIGRIGDILLYLDANSAILKCKILPTASEVLAASATPTTATSIASVVDITNNFPIQKWVFITVAVDTNGVCDYYLDGKLVKSVKAASTTITDAAQPIKFGTSHDTYIADLKRVPKVKGPQEVWNDYASGNSGSNLQSALGNYNVNLSILRDNVETSSYSLV